MQILFVVIHMVYQEKTRVPSHTVRETRVIGGYWSWDRNGFGCVLFAPTANSLRAAARNMGLGSWIGGGGLTHPQSFWFSYGTDEIRRQPFRALFDGGFSYPMSEIHY